MNINKYNNKLLSKKIKIRINNNSIELVKMLLLTNFNQKNNNNLISLRINYLQDKQFNKYFNTRKFNYNSKI